MSVKDRTSAILYTCATCNLNCRYCGIDKNPALKIVDNALEESFKGDYYFERIKKYFPDRTQLHEIQTWGGEPFYHMERINHTLEKVIEYYPYFNTFFVSTNFSYPEWTDKVFGLLAEFAKYPYRKFYVTIQLSCDGPEYINDANRGKGVTQRCLDNFNKLLSLLGNNVGENIHLNLQLKPTLDTGNIALLNTKEKIIDYYKFFEDNFIDKVNALNYSNVHMPISIPNTAVPSPVTVEQGHQFADMCKLCKELEQENKENPIFKYYYELVPMKPNPCQSMLTYKYSHHTCGIGSMSLGFLPDNVISTCHQGFTDFALEYKKYYMQSDMSQKTISFDEFIQEQPMKHCLTEEQYEDFEKMMGYFNTENSYSRVTTLVSEILALAWAGQIDKRFMNTSNALKAAIHVQSSMSFCVKDNYNETGSVTLYPIGNIKQILCGAEDYTWLEGELPLDDRK